MKIVTDVKKLRKPCKEASNPDDVLMVAGALFKTMGEDENCCGLSANQIGYDLRVFVMRNDPSTPICLVNPVLTKEKGHQLGEEGMEERAKTEIKLNLDTNKLFDTCPDCGSEMEKRWARRRSEMTIAMLILGGWLLLVSLWWKD